MNGAVLGYGDAINVQFPSGTTGSNRGSTLTGQNIVNNTRYGEEVCAWIVPKPGAQVTEDGIRAFCQGQIAHYKTPRHVRFVDEIPMTVTGKPQKFVMRQRMVEALGLTAPPATA